MDDIDDALRNVSKQNSNGIFRLCSSLFGDRTKARVIPLQVAGAFHTVHMAPAADELSDQWSDHDVSDPGVTLLSNTDGVAVATGAEFLGRLISQVRNPVRWDLCMETMTELGVTGLVELAPAGTLVGLAKRAMKGVPSGEANRRCRCEGRAPRPDAPQRREDAGHLQQASALLVLGRQERGPGDRGRTGGLRWRVVRCLGQGLEGREVGRVGRRRCDHDFAVSHLHLHTADSGVLTPRRGRGDHRAHALHSCRWAWT